MSELSEADFAPQIKADTSQAEQALLIAQIKMLPEKVPMMFSRELLLQMADPAAPPIGRIVLTGLSRWRTDVPHYEFFDMTLTLNE